MLCTNCGATNPDGASICASCKKPVNAAWQSPKSELLSADAGGPELEYAGFWERLAAMFLDGIVLLVVWMVAAFVIGIIGGVAAAAGGGAGARTFVPVLVLLFYAVLLLGMAAYYVLMESGERGATFGKRALKLRVVDMDGGRISKGRATGRFFAHFLSNMTFYIGYLIQPFTERKQALHDMVSGTLVVKTEKNSSGLAVAIGIVAAFVVILVIIGILAAAAIPAYQDYLAKANMIKAEAVGRAATRAVESYAAQTGKIPASLADTGVKLPTAPEVADVTVNPQDGQVQVVIGKGMPRTVAGKALVFDASRGADGKIVWSCSGPDIPPQMLPADCR